MQTLKCFSQNKHLKEKKNKDYLPNHFTNNNNNTKSTKKTQFNRETLTLTVKVCLKNKITHLYLFN